MHEIECKAVLAGPGEAAKERGVGQCEPLQEAARLGPFGAGKAQEERSDPREEGFKIHCQGWLCGETNEAQKLYDFLKKTLTDHLR